jgi:maltose O-acetyltransferase
MSLTLRSCASGVWHAPARLAGRVAAWRKRRHCEVAAGAVLLAPARIENHRGLRSAIHIGSGSRIAGQLLVFAHGGQIRIGEDCFVGEGTRIWSAASVTVGNRVLISHGVNIHDTNAHSTSARARHEHIVGLFAHGHPATLPDVPDSPVVIEDDAWIGFNATILKGVRIGRGAIVGAAAVVLHDVPDYSVVVGNPARAAGPSRP